MSNDESYKGVMGVLAEEYYSLLLEEEQIKSRVTEKRDEIQRTLSRFNRGEFDEPDYPVTVSYKLQSTGERMKKGGKEILKNMLSNEQWGQVYNPGEKKPRLTIKRRDKIRDYDGTLR